MYMRTEDDINVLIFLCMARAPLEKVSSATLGAGTKAPLMKKKR